VPANRSEGQERGPLFRQIAIEAAAGSQIGEPLKTHWRGVGIFTLVAFCLVAALLVFAAVTQYSPVDRVPCYVDVRGGLVQLWAPTAGYVRELTVEQGASVRRGAILAALDSDQSPADGGSEHGIARSRLDREHQTIGPSIVRAPLDGVVSAAWIARGQPVVAGQLLFTIAPAGEPLIVRMLVPASAVSLVKPGTNVKVVVRGYPQDKFGELLAHVENVSDSPSLPVEIEHVYAVTEPAFIATASLPAKLLSSSGQLLRIKAGMLADALVPLEPRSVLKWLFEPALRGFSDSTARPPAGTPAAVH